MTARAFWEWFLKNESRFLKADENEDVLDELQAALSSFNPGLSLEVSDEEDGVKDLIVSAEGNVGLFGVVEELKSAAPELSRWRLIALKPPRGFDFEFNWGDVSLRPSDLAFEPLSNKTDSSALGLRIFVPPTIDPQEKETLEAIRRIIDIGLGERIAASSIAHIELALMGPSARGAIPLPELSDYVEWKARHAQSRPVH